MKIIILSGGPGKSLWPFSNEARSKQFLKMLPVPESQIMESMIQRVVRQIKEAGIKAEIIVATNLQQRDSILSQLGPDVDMVLEPSRRDTFPAVCLACEYLSKIKNCSDDETILLMPCDQFTEISFFQKAVEMVGIVDSGVTELAMMGIPPASSSSKFGYIIPETNFNGGSEYSKVRCFKEKPDKETAANLINAGAFWNAGIYSCKLGFIRKIAEKFVQGDSYESIVAQFDEYPSISFDYEVTEKTSGAVVVPYLETWKDLGNWDSLLKESKLEILGNVSISGNENTHVLNELQTPILCVGTKNLIVAASPDGILIADKKDADILKEHTVKFKDRPMFEERRWGYYQVIDHVKFSDGYETLTKRLTLNPGCSISYQRHKFRDETWTFIDGEGLIIHEGEMKRIRRGETVQITKGSKHALYALTPLSFIEVQAGSNLIEEDIERFDWDWNIE